MTRHPRLTRTHRTAAVAIAAALTLPLGLAMTQAAAAGGTSASAASKTGSRCRMPGLGGAAKHVVYLQFDNTHLLRDNPNVPSDLEQMPTLLHFLTGHGTLLSQEHTPLIAHTADDIVTSETGVYGDRHGMPVSNTYQYYLPNRTSHTAGSFAYWTDPIVDYQTGLASRPVADPHPSMVDAGGDMAPAPWVAYTRAGCNVGAVAAANMELENTVPDVARVFGATSPQARLAADPNSSAQAKAAAFYEGLSIHCAKRSPLCAEAPGAVPDRLPAEPGGYAGYQALFGSRVISPVIHPARPVTDLTGKVITDSSGTVGFPGYNAMTGSNALAYTADMLEHGVPVTYTYLTDLHESWATGNAYGPGQAGYEQNLRAENAAFATFFDRLARDGITPANTLFVVTADEGDHFVGGPPTPSGCNGVTITCSYPKIGELQENLTKLLATQQGVTTPFATHDDSAPVFYLNGPPGRTAPVTRTFERAAARLTVANLITGTTERLTRQLADPIELRLLHMVTGDPKRTPTFVLFGNPDFYSCTSASSSCATRPPYVSEYSAEAWNHGDFYPQINRTWLGLVGPGVRNLGLDGSIWSDHTDIRPTMTALLGLRDDYAYEGRPLFEVMTPAATSPSIRRKAALVIRLGQVFTQLNAPVGQLGAASLRISTVAVASASPDDEHYARLEGDLAAIIAQRDDIVSQMQQVISGAVAGSGQVDPERVRDLINRGEQLLGRVDVLAVTP